jgi:hypothetical protein
MTDSPIQVGDVVEWDGQVAGPGGPERVTFRGLVYRVSSLGLAYVHDPSRDLKFKTAVVNLRVVRRTRLEK